MIIGVDEVGRGCWAGPLLAAAVEFNNDLQIAGLRDSKRMTRLQREKMITSIKGAAVQYGVGWVWPSEINVLGLTKSVQLAMQRAIDQLSLTDQDIIIDGNFNYLPNIAGTSCLIKADDSIQAVAAASVLAKVARDQYMAKLSVDHPGYGFEKHVGYGTSAHQSALSTLGVIQDVHRLSYKPIQKLLAQQ